ncbi:MAG: hypothetical protein JW874_08450 [Spirochaetales bacterium]|nr:hypothetical protein [Spirochaetales bacterium]
MKILCIGQCSYDLIFQLDYFPVEDSKNTAAGFSACTGGPAANAALLCARWGGDSWFCGSAANDDIGCIMKEQLTRQKVHTDLFFLSEQAVTPVSSILVHNSTSTRTVINYRKNTDAALPSSPGIRTDDFRALLMDGHELSAALQYLGAMPAAVSVLDAGSYRPATAELFAKVNWPVCSEVFACKAAGVDSISPDNTQDILAGLCIKLGNPNVAVTLGPRGVVWKEKDSFFRLPAFPVDAVDSSAAGDIFHGAFTWFLADGLETGECMIRASAAAALSVSRYGSSASIPGLQETLELRRKFPQIHPTLF